MPLVSFHHSTFDFLTGGAGIPRWSQAFDDIVNWAYSRDSFDNAPRIFLPPEEQRRLRLRLGTWGQRVALSPRLTVRLTPESPIRVCGPGGTPGDGPVVVAVGTDGAVEFDALIRDLPPRRDEPFSCGRIRVSGSISGVDYGSIPIASVQPAEPLPCTVTEVPPDDPIREKVDPTPGVGRGEETLARVEWPATPSAVAFCVEATRDETGRDWFPVVVKEPGATGWLCFYRLDDSRTASRGPLRFRVIPIVKLVHVRGEEPVVIDGAGLPPQ